MKFNISLCISKAKHNAILRDLDRKHQDIVLEGEEMQDHISKLWSTAKSMPNLPIGDALNIAFGSLTDRFWS